MGKRPKVVFKATILSANPEMSEEVWEEFKRLKRDSDQTTGDPIFDNYILPCVRAGKILNLSDIILKIQESTNNWNRGVVVEEGKEIIEKVVNFEKETEKIESNLKALQKQPSDAHCKKLSELFSLRDEAVSLFKQPGVEKPLRVKLSQYRIYIEREIGKEADWLRRLHDNKFPSVEAIESFLSGIEAPVKIGLITNARRLYSIPLEEFEGYLADLTEAGNLCKISMITILRLHFPAGFGANTTKTEDDSNEESKYQEVGLFDYHLNGIDKSIKGV